MCRTAFYSINHSIMTIKKTIALIIATTCLCSCSIAQDRIKAEGADLTITPKVGKFDAINVGSAFELNYTVGKSASVSFTAPASLSQYVKVETSGGTLNCYYSTPNNQNTDWNGRKVVINVTAPAVDEFKSSGASSIKISSALSAKELEFKASGASTISAGNITSTKCNVDASGASNITIGNADVADLEIELSGASSAKVSGKAGDVDIDVSGASSCNIRNLAISSGEIETSGASNVNANSSARNCKTSTSGASKVTY